MKKQTLTLALLVSLLLLVNTLFILMVQITKHDVNVDVTQRSQGEVIRNIVSQVSHQEPLEIFEPKVIKKYTPETSSREKEKPQERYVEIDGGRYPLIKKTFSGEREVSTQIGKEITINYDEGLTIINGREFPTIIDSDSPEGYEKDFTKSPQETYVNLSDRYTRYNLYIEQDYFNNNTDDLLSFFDLFEPRFDFMEETTGWSSEAVAGAGQKLDMYVTRASSGCWGGVSFLTETHLELSDPLYLPSCEKSSYQEGVPITGNAGDLGDDWFYMAGALHESLHSINPYPLFVRLWLTEGFSQYNQYNILEGYGDINQETADYYIFNSIYIDYTWTDYLVNDYRDGLNNEIQGSAGYDITAWMFTMMRENHSLDFGDFYSLLNANQETLEKADSMWEISDYFTDMVVIEVFGRSVGWDFNATKDVWEYDGPSGPGWGVRQWVNTSWYADLVVNDITYEITQSPDSQAPPDVVTRNTDGSGGLDQGPPPGNPVKFRKDPDLIGEKIEISPREPGEPWDYVADLHANVSNTGETDLEEVSVSFYRGLTKFHEEAVDIAAGEMVQVDAVMARNAGNYLIRVIVDADNVKLETNDDNNEHSIQVVFD